LRKVGLRKIRESAVLTPKHPSSKKFSFCFFIVVLQEKEYLKEEGKLQSSSKKIQERKFAPFSSIPISSKNSSAIFSGIRVLSIIKINFLANYKFNPNTKKLDV